MQSIERQNASVKQKAFADSCACPFAANTIKYLLYKEVCYAQNTGYKR